MKIPDQLITKKRYSFFSSLFLLSATAVLNTYFDHEYKDGLNALISLILTIEIVDFLDFRYRVKTGRYGNNERDLREILAFKAKHRH